MALMRVRQLGWPALLPDGAMLPRSAAIASSLVHPSGVRSRLLRTVLSLYVMLPRLHGREYETQRLGGGLAFLLFERLAHHLPCFGGLLPKRHLVADDFLRRIAANWRRCGGWRCRLAALGGRYGRFDGLAAKERHFVKHTALGLLSQKFVDNPAKPYRRGRRVVAKLADGDHLSVHVQVGISQDLSIPERQVAGSDHVLQVSAQLQQFDAELNLDLADASRLGAICDCPAKAIYAYLVGSPFVDWVKVNPSGILCQHNGAGFGVGQISDNGGYAGPSQKLTSAKAAFPCDDLVKARLAKRAHRDRLDQAMLLDAGSQVSQGCSVELGTILASGSVVSGDYVGHVNPGNLLLGHGAVPFRLAYLTS